MKRFLLLLLVALMGVSCNPEKKQMEDVLISCLKSPSSYRYISFEKREIITLSREVDDRIEYYTEILEWDNYDIDRSEKEINSENDNIVFWTKYRNNDWVKYHQEQLTYWKKEKEKYVAKKQKDEKVFNYLNKLKTYNVNNNDYYDYPTFYVYRLIYESQNGFGASLKDCCYGRFTKDGELVAIKLGEEEEWNLLGNFYSIPNYYELLNDQPTWSNVEESTNSQNFGTLGNAVSSKSITPVQTTNFLDEIFHQDGVFVSPLTKMFGYLALFLMVYFFLLICLFLITLPFRR